METKVYSKNDGRVFSDKVFRTYQELISESVRVGMDRAAQKELFVRRLDTVGDGSGTVNMAVNGSVTPVVFKVKPPVGEVWRIATWNLYVQDGGSFDAAGWGNGIVMVNGMVLELINDGVVALLQFPIKTSGDVAAITQSVNFITIGTGDNIMTAIWSFIDSGQYLVLDGSKGHTLQVIVNDDLTSLSSQYIQVSGYKE
jgi:hypothetical protein